MRHGFDPRRIRKTTTQSAESCDDRALLLASLHGHTAPELAPRFDLTPEAVRARTSRTRHLRSALDEVWCEWTNAAGGSNPRGCAKHRWIERRPDATSMAAVKVGL